MLAQELVHLVAEPRRVPELEREPQVARQEVEEARQPLEVGLQVGRQLQEHRPQPARLPQRLQRAEEVLQRLASAFLQPVPVGDRLVRLDREHEPGRRGLDPRRHRLLRRHVAEGVVDLDAVQPAGVVPQEPRRRQVLRVEVGLPRRVRVARCPCVERRHGSSFRPPGSHSDGRRAEEGPAAPPVCFGPARWRAGQTPPPSLRRAAARVNSGLASRSSPAGKDEKSGGSLTHPRRHDNRGDRR